MKMIFFTGTLYTLCTTKGRCPRQMLKKLYFLAISQILFPLSNCYSTIFHHILYAPSTYWRWHQWTFYLQSMKGITVSVKTLHVRIILGH